MVNIFKPIPSYEKALEQKARVGYQAHPANEDDVRFDEKMVPLSEYGVRGTSYYASPNGVLEKPLDWLSPEVFVRESLANKLQATDKYLRGSLVARMVLGANVGLDIRDGYRSPELQDMLYHAYFDYIKERNPDMDDEAIAKKRDSIIAAGNRNSPHASGGVVDLNLINLDTEQPIFNGQGKNIAKDAVRPEYLENVLVYRRTRLVRKMANFALSAVGKSQEIPYDEGMETDIKGKTFIRALLARRILYNLMTSDIGGLSLEVNPNEVWHYGAGDKLSESVRSFRSGDVSEAYYLAAEEPDGYRLPGVDQTNISFRNR